MMRERDEGEREGGMEGGRERERDTYNPLSTRKMYVGISPSLYTASPVEKSTAEKNNNFHPTLIWGRGGGLTRHNAISQILQCIFS